MSEGSWGGGEGQMSTIAAQLEAYGSELDFLEGLLGLMSEGEAYSRVVSRMNSLGPKCSELRRELRSMLGHTDWDD